MTVGETDGVVCDHDGASSFARTGGTHGAHTARWKRTRRATARRAHTEREMTAPRDSAPRDGAARTAARRLAERTRQGEAHNKRTQLTWRA